MDSSVPAATRFAAWLLLLLAAGLLFFGRLGSPLLEPEEALYAEIPREMAAVGSWVVPVHRGRPYYEKPPLLTWLIMAGYATFGVHEWAARLVPGAAALGTVLVTFWWGTRTLGFRAGLAGAWILCLSPRFVHQARMITMDGLLGLWVVSGLALGQKALGPGRLAWGAWLLSAATCGLGLLTKGPVALALVVVPLLSYQLLNRRTARPRVRCWLAYLGTAVGLALPWYGAMAWRDSAFLGEFFWNHHVRMRFLQPMHEEPAWFYLPVLALGMLPWTLLLPALVQRLWRRAEPAADSRPAGLGFLLLCGSWCVVFFSAAECKRIGYILPAMPPLALALGFTLDGCLRGRGTWLPFWATQGVLAVGIASALLAASDDLVKPARALGVVMLAAAAMVWLVCRCRRQTPVAAWTACGLATFALLLLAVHGLLPSYYHKFSMRSQVRCVTAAASRPEVPAVCYPHHWDSISFYLGRQAVRSYSHAQRDRLMEGLRRRPETLVFVKSGPALDELLRSLPPSLEFVPKGRARTVTAGLVRRRADASAKPRNQLFPD
jgi:4-amino-4-deoxy-L-arabinose transferase-like glycosyltransferase